MSTTIVREGGGSRLCWALVLAKAANTGGFEQHDEPRATFEGTFLSLCWFCACKVWAMRTILSGKRRSQPWRRHPPLLSRSRPSQK
eukprot:5962467-Amphidinium_carterae.1